MVHLRLNAREANPNPHINWISALPQPQPSQDATNAARELLRALAAQVRPVMKKHGLAVNSLEEYEWNQVFAGRNWEAGETIELVLRRPDGRFYGTSYLLNVFCHELAHIKHMNHLPAFHAYWKRLNREVAALRQAGYFGDGFWSAGQVLRDGAREAGQEEDEVDAPEYLCGGAHEKPAPRKATRKRKPRQQTTASERTGAQSSKKRKAGSRVKAKNAFKGPGQALNTGFDDETKQKLGTGFRKQARSKRARDERAAAIEARLQKMKGPSTSAPPPIDDSETEPESSEEDYEVVRHETDQDRRKLMDGMDRQELEGLKSINPSQHSSGKDKLVPKKSTTLQVSDDEDGPRQGNLLTYFGFDLEEIRREGRQVLQESELAESEVAKSSTGIPGSGQWVCVVCTFLNHPDLQLCEMCDTSRNSALS